VGGVGKNLGQTTNNKKIKGRLEAISRRAKGGGAEKSGYSKNIFGDREWGTGSSIKPD